MTRTAKRTLAGLVVSAAALAPAGAAMAAGTSVTVSPHRGTARAQFTVSFRAPDSAGGQGTVSRSYEVVASARAGRRCVSSAAAYVGRATAGSTVSVKLTPRRGRWCLERFAGAVYETTGPVCDPVRPGTRYVCPEFVSSRRQIGTFSFRVRRRR